MGDVVAALTSAGYTCFEGEDALVRYNLPSGDPVVEGPPSKLFVVPHLPSRPQKVVQRQVRVHAQRIGDVIGRQGQNLKTLCTALHVRVDCGKRWVDISGRSALAVKYAKHVVEDILMYGHHEITHPGQVHAHFDAESHQLAWIIGKRASGIKHLERSYGVKVHIPGRDSLNPMVVVRGEHNKVQGAVKYIEGLLVRKERAEVEAKEHRFEQTCSRADANVKPYSRNRRRQWSDRDSVKRAGEKSAAARYRKLNQRKKDIRRRSCRDFKEHLSNSALA